MRHLLSFGTKIVFQQFFAIPYCLSIWKQWCMCDPRWPRPLRWRASHEWMVSCRCRHYDRKWHGNWWSQRMIAKAPPIHLFFNGTKIISHVYFIKRISDKGNLLNLISPKLMESAKFSSELLLFMPRGMTMPMGKSFLFGTALVKSYVVQPMPDDESVTMSSLTWRFCRNARLARVINNNSYNVDHTKRIDTIDVTMLRIKMMW